MKSSLGQDCNSQSGSNASCARRLPAKEEVWLYCPLLKCPSLSSPSRGAQCSATALQSILSDWAGADIQLTSRREYFEGPSCVMQRGLLRACARARRGGIAGHALGSVLAAIGRGAGGPLADDSCAVQGCRGFGLVVRSSDSPLILRGAPNKNRQAVLAQVMRAGCVTDCTSKVYASSFPR